MESYSMSIEMFHAIDRAATGKWGDLWFQDEEVLEFLKAACRNKWALRISHTQAQWTEAGVYLAKTLGYC